ncbi:MAG: hypothetical protein FWF06_02625 [Symbiobacteriaceae bacterium]|nr:hypothetical protein [Symbiobacteriaceae bacterium]
MPTLYEVQRKVNREENAYRLAQRRLLRRSMWISIFFSLTICVALFVYVWATQHNIYFPL